MTQILGLNEFMAANSVNPYHSLSYLFHQHFTGRLPIFTLELKEELAAIDIEFGQHVSVITETVCNRHHP